MSLQEIIKLANSNGIYTNMFLRLVDNVSGNTISGIFTKYKQFETDSLRIKNNNCEVVVINKGKVCYTVIYSSIIKTKDNVINIFNL